jgi:homoserine O-acetyltransferase
MDLHDLGRGRSGLAGALSRIRVPMLTMSISSDTLYPPHQQELLRDAMRSVGGSCDHVVIDSPDGHDAFLLETAQVGAALAPFLADLEKS